MSDDSFSEVSSRSWLSRLTSAIGGVVVGIVLFILSFALLTWNEGRAIKRAKTLEAGATQVVSVASAPVNALNEGRLVHVTGEVTAAGTVGDKAFGLDVDALKLRRSVEMFQWVEEKKSETKQKLGGGEETVTTYSYAKKWVSEPVDSSSFAKPQGHENPGEFPLETRTFVGEDIQIGDFGLPESLVDRIDGFEPLAVEGGDPGALEEKFGHPVHAIEDGFFIGSDTSRPTVGDLRVRFSQVPAGSYSVVARQSGNDLVAFPVGKLGEIEMIQPGNVPAEAMFAAEREGNTMLTWLLRLVGFLVMAFGLNLIMSPLAVLASVVPFLGWIVESGIGFITFALALPLSLVTISVAWLAYRPLVAIPLIVLAIASAVFAARKFRKPKPAAT